MRTLGKIVFDVVVALGALACIFQFLEIKPKDFGMISIPHYLWLILGLTLFAISLWSSLRSYTASSHEAAMLREEIGSVRNKLAEEMSAKENREGRLNELRTHFEELKKQLDEERNKPLAVTGEKPNQELVDRLARFENAQSQLKIISAFYGLPGTATDMDVTKILQQHERTGLVALITNNLFGKDPFENKPKRLQVEYSYGGQPSSVITRQERDLLILPEDQLLRAQIPVPVENPAKDVRMQTYHLIRSAFVPLTWAQRISLKRILSQPQMLLEHVRDHANSCGFADPENAIVRPLLANRVLIDSDERCIWVKSDDVRKVLEQMFREFPL